MAYYPSRGALLWIAEESPVQYPPLDGNLEVDVAIIGGGIAGLTAAYSLKQGGKRVAVFEKYRIGDGVTGYTTGKVSSQHGVVYSEPIEKHDENAARYYGQINQSAIKQIEAIITSEALECDWRRELFMRRMRHVLLKTALPMAWPNIRCSRISLLGSMAANCQECIYVPAIRRGQ